MSAEFTMGRDVPTEALPYSERKQQATIGWMVRDDSFFRQTAPRLKAKWFASALDQKLVQAMLVFGEAYGRRPRPEELRESPSSSPEDPQTKERLRARLDEVLAAAAVIGRDVLEAELTEWLQAIGYQSMIEGTLRLYNGQKVAEALAFARDRVRDIIDTRFVRDAEVDPGDYPRLFDERKEELGDALTFGHSAVDRLLNPSAKSGSLLRRQMTLLLGTVNSGKTRTMTTCVRHNAMRGKNVLFLIHEGDFVDISTNLFASLLSRPKEKVWVTPQMVQEVFYGSEPGRELLGRARDLWREHICVLPIIKSGLTVEEVVTTVRQKQDEWAAKHGGRGFDLIVDDYPAILDTVQNSKGNMQERNVRHRIYLQFSQLGEELDAHVIAAVQGNRESSKAVRGKSERGRKRLLTREDIEESWGPAQTAVNIITINRDEQMEHEDKVIYYIDKSRSGRTGYAVVCRSRYDAVVTHDDSMPASWYVGTGSYTGLLERMLVQYPDQQVPLDLLLEAA